MRKLIIQGGNPLKGAVRLGGAKNSSYKLMIAALLCPHETRLLNLSRIADVQLVKDIINSLGAKAYSAGDRTMFIDATKITSSNVPLKLGKASRASSMFIAPLLARTKTAFVPLPGGDKIGKRPLERHLEGLKSMGAMIEYQDGGIKASTSGLVGTKYRFEKNSHTGTETMIIASVLAKGTTRLENAALEPEIDDLIEMLNNMGAKITRLPNRVIKIIGVKSLQPVIHKVMPDRNEAVSYAIAAIVTQGDIILENANAEHMTTFLDKLTLAGGQFEIANYGIRFYYQKPLQAIDITTQPHPGTMSDWQPLLSVMATQSRGTSNIIEAVFTSRFQFADSLIKMGANISFFDPKPKDPDTFYNFNLDDDRPENKHGMIIVGPTKLKGGSFTINDIRAGATMALAGLAATGQTTLSGLEHIDRGYENFAGRLLQLGAKIKEL